MPPTYDESVGAFGKAEDLAGIFRCRAQKTIRMSFPHPLRTLAQLPNLSRLAAVCAEFDIEITLFGSVVRRLAKALIVSQDDSKKSLPDLFELVPFLSDIDLRHSGKAEKSDEIRRAILSCIPFSEYFRWEIFSEEEYKPFREDEVYLPVIPADRMALSTRAGNGIQDPFGGHSDLRRRKYRLLRSPYYQRSRLWRDYKDCEFLSLLNYIKLLFEEPVFDKEQPGWVTVEEIARESRTPALIGALQESAYLRARFRYRSQALRAMCRDTSAWKDVTQTGEVGETIRYINQGLPFRVLDVDLPNEDNGLTRLLVSSCRLIGDSFRLAVPPLPETGLENAAKRWEQAKESRVGMMELTKHPFPRLAPGLHIVADTPEFEFNRGKAPSAILDEHLHIQMPLTGESAEECRKYGETKLGAVALITAEEKPETPAGKPKLHSLFFPFPSVCRVVEPRDPTSPPLLQIRANSGHLLEALPELARENFRGSIGKWRIKLFVVGEDTTPEGTCANE